jgi:uncharacterized protein YfdQ (DUF2303 family)
VTDTNDATVAALMAAGAVAPVSYGADALPDVLAAVVPAGYTLWVEDLSGFDRLKGAPRRVTAAVHVNDVSAWLDYYRKYSNPAGGVEVFADVRTNRIVGILDAPLGPGAPRFGEHTVTLTLRRSAAWTAWTSRSGVTMRQHEFAEHLEDRSPDLVDPDAATMLEIAATISATAGVKFESGVHLASGQRRFQYLETVEGKAGRRGELTIPSQFTIQVQVWRGVPIVVPMTARLRYRIASEGLTLGYVLDRVEDVEDAAWQALLDEFRGQEAGLEVLAGVAPEYTGG